MQPCLSQGRSAGNARNGALWTSRQRRNIRWGTLWISRDGGDAWYARLRASREGGKVRRSTLSLCWNHRDPHWRSHRISSLDNREDNGLIRCGIGGLLVSGG